MQSSGLVYPHRLGSGMDGKFRFVPVSVRLRRRSLGEPGYGERSCQGGIGASANTVGPPTSDGANWSTVNQSGPVTRTSPSWSTVTP